VSAPVVHRLRRGYGTGLRVFAGNWVDPTTDVIPDLTPGQLLEVYVDATVRCDEPERLPWYKWATRPPGEQNAWFDIEIQGADRITPQIAAQYSPLDWADPMAFRRRELWQATSDRAVLKWIYYADCGPDIIVASAQVSVIVWPL
jgi:hypothetical protein